MRTGAGAAVGLKHLRTDGADEVAILGTGHMACGSLLAVAATIELRRARVWSPTEANRTAFAERLAHELGIEVVASDTAQACVADVPMVVTEAPEPFLRTDWFAPGTTIYVLGRLQELERDRGVPRPDPHGR